jgi:hypothetical protein
MAMKSSQLGYHLNRDITILAHRHHFLSMELLLHHITHCHQSKNGLLESHLVHHHHQHISLLLQ